MIPNEFDCKRTILKLCGKQQKFTLSLQNTHRHPTV